MINSFKFSIHLSDPSTNIIQKKITYVTVYDDVEEEVIFRGRVYSISSSTDGFMEVTCEGPLSYLKDGVYRGPDIKSGDHVYTLLYNGFTFGDYNLFVDNKRKFVPQFEWIEHGERDASEWRSQNGVIKESLEVQGSNYYDFWLKIMEYFGWDFKVESTSTTTYSSVTPSGTENPKACYWYELVSGVYILTEDVSVNIQKTYYKRSVSGPYWKMIVSSRNSYQSTTPITVGLNLKSLTKSTSDDDEGFYTTVFPMGGYCYDNRRLQLKEPGAGSPLDNRTANNQDSLPGNTTAAGSVTGDTICAYVDNTKLVKKYGRIIKCVIFDDVVANSLSEKASAKQALYKRAVDCAKKLSEPTFDFDISGYDLSKAGYPVDELVCGVYYEVIDPITNTNIVARLKAMTKYYEKPNEPDLTMEYKNFSKEDATR